MNKTRKIISVLLVISVFLPMAFAMPISASSGTVGVIYNLWQPYENGFVEGTALYHLYSWIAANDAELTGVGYSINGGDIVTNDSCTLIRDTEWDTAFASNPGFANGHADAVGYRFHIYIDFSGYTPGSYTIQPYFLFAGNNSGWRTYGDGFEAFLDFTAEDENNYQLLYTVSGNTCYVSGYTGTPVNVTVPMTKIIDGTAYAVTAIGNNAFKECTDLISISLPGSITSIGTNAFRGCSGLESVTIPQNGSLTSIGGYAFAYCSKLKSIAFPDSIASIAAYTFFSCGKLTSAYVSDINIWLNIDFGNFYANPLAYAKNLYFGDGLVTDVVIPDGYTTVRKYTFRNYAKLSTVTIPNSVITIENNAFYTCSGLTTVYYNGSSEEWDGISVGINNESLLNAELVCTPAPSNVLNIVIDSVTAAPGEEVDVTIRLVNNVTISSCKLFIEVPEGLTFEKCVFDIYDPDDDSSMRSGKMSATIPNTLILNWSSAMDEVTGDCVYATVTFEVDDNAADGVYELNVTIDPNDIFDKDQNNVDFVIVPGVVTVESAGTYTVIYNANGGTDSPSPQLKYNDVDLTLSSELPEKSYTITYNANGGTVRPSIKTVYAQFVAWKAQNGTIYAPGSVYSANADLTLSAQWADASAGELAIPEKEGCLFDGWFTKAEGGVQIQPDTSITGNTAVYAHWTVIPVLPTDPVRIVADKGAAAYPGVYVTLKIKLENNKAISSCKLKVFYPAELTYVDATIDIYNDSDETAVKCIGAYNDGELVLNWLTANGEIKDESVLFATVTFKVADDAKYNDCYDVIVTADPDDIYDYNMDPVAYVIENGKITVTGVITGDVNGDARLDNKDVVLLVRYLSGYPVTIIKDVADFNSDGKLNNKDITALFRYVLYN